ncbi:HEAT repeat domain-containing protein [Synechococcus sp. GEYO]|uniref:HEAT repeat domain-containing protein n=1 Tax=Synechococcus sp. GEYO TaxID=2575511 RepID=UPI000E0EBDB1|nr:HEAT repeat domain-containing protein [Synechococcus sp. GEYO]
MNQLLAGGAALVLVIVLWSLGRRPGKTLLSSTDATSVAAINRAQLGLVQDSSPQQNLETQAGSGKGTGDLAPFQPPVSSAERISLERRLREAMDQGNPGQRLEAVRVAGQWGHASVLPLLRRGLRDADSLVVEAAATAIERHRGATRPSPAQVARPPRNVARMR